MTERIVLYELDGKTYLGGFGLLRYEGGWKIRRLDSNLAGLSSFGTVEKTTYRSIRFAAYLGAGGRLIIAPMAAKSVLAFLPAFTCSGREDNKLHADVGVMINRPLCTGR